MELIPFLIIAVIAFNIFKGFNKASSKSNPSPKTLMQRLNAEMEKAGQLQKETPHNSRSRNLTPTQRGRESLQSKGQTPWGGNGAASSGARMAAKYLKKEKAKRKAAQKSPEQKGRRGRNVDQNRNRTYEWGERGDNGLLSPRNVIILLVAGAVILHVLSLLPAI